MSVDVATNLYAMSASQLDCTTLVLLTHLYGCLQFKEDWLRDEDLTRFCAKIADLGFEELNLLAWSTAANLEQTVYDAVEIDVIWFGHACCTANVLS